MARVLKLTCLVMFCMVAAAAAPMAANAALSCGTVTSKLAPCINYLSKGGAVPPPCCAGVKGLNSLAQTTPDRQQACRCLQNAARSMGDSFNAGRASGLPGACGVRVPYPISASTNCNSVK